MCRVTVSQENFVPVKPIPPSSLSTLRFIDCKDRALFPHESRRVSASTDARICIEFFPRLKKMKKRAEKIFTIRKFQIMKISKFSHADRSLLYANNYFVEKKNFTISKIIIIIKIIIRRK